jgi:hypothetical protein
VATPGMEGGTGGLAATVPPTPPGRPNLAASTEQQTAVQLPDYRDGKTRDGARRLLPEAISSSPLRNSQKWYGTARYGFSSCQAQARIGRTGGPGGDDSLGSWVRDSCTVVPAAGWRFRRQRVRKPVALYDCAASSLKTVYAMKSRISSPGDPVIGNYWEIPAGGAPGLVHRGSASSQTLCRYRPPVPGAVTEKSSALVLLSAAVRLCLRHGHELYP